MLNNPAFYSTTGPSSQNPMNDTMMNTKWNSRFVTSFATKEATAETMNKGISYLVAPHNLSFNKRAIQTNGSNHTSVIGSIQEILDRHNVKESKKLKGMSPEMAAKAVK